MGNCNCFKSEDSQFEISEPRKPHEPESSYKSSVRPSNTERKAAFDEPSIKSVYDSLEIDPRKLEEAIERTTQITKTTIRKFKGCFKCMYPKNNMHSLECNHQICLNCLNKVCIYQGSFKIFDSIKSPCCNKTITKADLSKFYDLELLNAIENDPGIKRFSYECAICLETFLVNDMKTLECDHRFCNDCLKEHLNDKIMSGNVKDNVLLCPSCKANIDVHIVQNCVDDHVFEKFNEFGIKQLTLDFSEVMKECPFCQCNTIIDRNLKIMKCPNPNCNKEFCTQCDADHKETCEEYKNSLKSKLDTFTFEVSFCPKCKNGVTKEGGCNFIRCVWPGCNTFFCLLCSTEMTIEDHYTHYKTSGPFGDTCNTLEAEQMAVQYTKSFPDSQSAQ